MPNFVSKGGVWEPATEETVIKKVSTDGTVKHEVYHGPDREAAKYIAENGGIGAVGMDASKDPQLIQASRTAGFNSVKEYLDYNKPTEVQVKIKAEADSKVVTHSDQAPKEGVSPSLGGFNDEGVSPEEAVMTKKRGRPKGS
jgi:hypothetical protein